MGILLDKISNSLIDYYSKRADAHEESSQQVGWKSTAAQQNRFLQLIKVIEGSHKFSINDLGCGLGDLSRFLHEKGFSEFSYNGYDTFQLMIDGAKKNSQFFKNSNFIKISNPNEMALAEYTVASGILNIRFEISDEEWLRYILEMIDVMNDKSSKGFAFNALTSYSDEEYRRPELYYTDPCFIFDYCKRNISKNVSLIHDYQEYDFTIIVRK
jgi:SAM-dependent methyltransferase